MDAPLTFVKSLGKRLAQVRAEIGMTEAEFAASLDTPLVDYAAYETGDGQMTMAFLRALHDKHDVNPAWLLSGEGERRNQP